MRTNTGITVYNRYASSGSEAYQRTQIPAVEWENRKASNVIASGGNMAADSAVVYIPFTCDGSENYTKPKAWQALSSKTGKWTLQNGDYVVKGLVTDTISASFTISQLKAKYDDVLQVSSVDTFDMGSVSLQHWKVSGR
ncbi:MAG: hypothetical protein EHM33_00960 [Chloroflexi bacterium]|nr:MAG: hypothetical protein EHM33_00960 [Chloroflexota bacterium]